MTRAYKSPKPFIFILKRSEFQSGGCITARSETVLESDRTEIDTSRVVEPVSNFEDPSDYLYTFSSEESTAWRLMAAIYDAKVSRNLDLSNPASS